MAAGSKESAPPDLSDESVEELRNSLHTKVDEIFKPGLTGAEIYLGCLNLSGQLIQASAPLFDIAVGHHLISTGATKISDPYAAGKCIRDDLKSLVFGLPGPTTKSTAEAGILGAWTIVGNLASTSGDSYLHVLATALSELRVGQVHPWLVPPRAGVHPPQHAKRVLDLRAVPFCTIEYLVASGRYRKKTDAKYDVLDRLNISQETFKDWRKQQLDRNPTEFKLRLSNARLYGAQVKMYREKEKALPEMRILIDSHDHYLGLPAVEGTAKALETLGANKGKK